jgi:hypothetical protein
VSLKIYYGYYYQLKTFPLLCPAKKFPGGADAKIAVVVGWQFRRFKAPNYDFTPNRTNLQSILNPEKLIDLKASITIF